jgi:malonyl-CoA O-methyltransferase
MNAQTQFSRFAEAYDDYNVIQRRVVGKLLDDLQGETPMRILDLGCGKGALHEALPWNPAHLLAVDFAPRMLELHPKGSNVECIYGDFNDTNLFEHLRYYRFERIFSASALQWSEDLDRTFSMVAALQAPVSLALFTAGTFKTLYETAGLKPMLASAAQIDEAASCHFGGSVETLTYRLAFESTREMFRYIKRSGVSGGRNVLGYKEAKQLMACYPLEYLEFEVCFVKT